MAILRGRRVAWTRRESRRARRLQVSVDWERGVEVVVPARARRVNAEAFLLQHQDWILERLKERDRLALRAPAREYRDHGCFPLLGASCPLRWQPAARARVTYEEGIALVAAPELPTAEEFRLAAERLCRRIAREIYESRVEHWRQILGVTVGKVRVAGQKTRWGSCSNSGTISLNWRLVLGPMRILDYVVAHELTHLIHFDHGPGFQATLDRVLPDWRDDEAWLTENGELLRL